MATISHESQTRVDQILTNLTTGYGSQAHIGDMIFPVIPVKEDTGIFFVWDENGMDITGLDTRRADTAKVKLIEMGVTTDTYKCDQYALGEQLPDSIVKNAHSVLRLRESYAQNVIETLDTAREVAVKNIVFAAATYATGLKTTLATNDRWSITHADSNPIADIQAALYALLLKVGVTPGQKSRLIIGPDGELYLRQHALIKAQVQYVYGTGYDNMSLAAIAPILGVDEIVVGKSRYNTAKEGQTKSFDFVWKTHAALILTAGGAQINRPAFGYRFVPTHTPRTVHAYRPEGILAEQIDVNEKYDLKVTFQKAGYFFENAFDIS